MGIQNWRRKRGVILTTKGLQKLQESKRKLEAEENFGNRYTLEEMSALSGLYSSTISKVLNREGGVDKQTLEKLFEIFDLKIDKSDYLSSNTRIDWGEAICTSVFYGRKEELTKLEQWIVDDRCQLVAVLGMGGIGKTALSVKLAQQIQESFEYVIWRSLREAPPLKTILANLIQVLSEEQETESNLPENLSDRVTRLLDYLRSSRCLVVLDNAESILASGSRAGLYREGYSGYGELIKRVGEATHQSCLVLTSRENPKEVALLKGLALPVRSLQLSGLKVEEGQEIFKIKGLDAALEEWKVIIEHYAGNPLALKIVATTILDVFDGNVTEFLQQNSIVFGDIRDLLDQHFKRLSDLEKEIMYTLAINCEPVSLSELREDIVSPIPPQKLLDALESLLRRCLIDKATSVREEKSTALFTLQAVVMEYVNQVLIERVCEEIATENINLFRCHAIIKATAKDYVRETQIRLILQPVIDGLLTIFRSKKGIENRLTQILAKLREESPLEVGYTAGNIFNLLCHLETDLSGYDFSYLTVWQADLRNVNLHNVSFQNANLAKCVFAETLGGIHSVAFSPDGKLLAVGENNGDIRLCQVADGKQLLICKGHKSWIWSVTFSPDGNLVASGSDDQTVKLWEVNTGKCLTTLRGHNGGVRSVAFSSDSYMLASGSNDQTVRLWDIGTGKCLKNLQGHGKGVLSVTFSPNSYTLASSSEDQTVKLWDITTGRYVQNLQGHSDWVCSVAFSPDGQTLASGSHDQTVKLWNINTARCLLTLQGHTNWVHSVAFSSDGQTLASGSEDQTVRLWDVSTGKCLKNLQGNGNRVWSIALSPDSYTLASANDNQTIKLWDITTGRCLKTLQGYSNRVWSVTFSPKGTILASGSEDQTVKLWDVSTGECLKTLRGHSNRVISVTFSPQGIILASGSEDQTVKLWDVSTGECLKTLQGHSNRVSSVTFSPDGQILASCSEDQTVKLWDVSTGLCHKTMQGHSGRVWSVAFSPEGNTLASGGHDQKVRLWDVSTSQCLQILQGHTGWVWSVTFASPIGDAARTQRCANSVDLCILASGSSDHVVKLWDASSGQLIGTLEEHTNCVYSVAFSPDGDTLASASGDHTVKLWDVSTSSCVRTLSGHDKLVWSIAFSPDGQTLVSGSDDETIKHWNVQTGECLKTLRCRKPYEGMNITGVTDLTEVTIATLKDLGAVEYKED